MYHKIFAVVGESPGPAIAILNSNLSSKFVFFYTEEMEENAAYMSTFFEKQFQDIDIEFISIPSISKPTIAIKSINDAVTADQCKKNLALFVTSGAKQIVLPFIIANRKFTLLSLKDGRKNFKMSSVIQCLEESGAVKEYPTSIPVEDVLQIRGWNFLSDKESVGLTSDKFTVNRISASVSTRTGRLAFNADVGKREEFLANDVIAQMLLLSQSFGRNGAGYMIKGKLTRRIRNVLPSFIRLNDSFWYEEE